ncbi:MAG: hypothetical protein GY822_19615, partial [Deltaproteobacteria bacterium]|nr:hypothetical protein [Deltaproteobacteria bacterium]
MPLKNRQSLRDIAVSTGLSVHQLRRLLKEEKLKKQKSNANPLLTEANREESFTFCSSFINVDTNTFDDMYNRVHIDEKLFYLKPVKSKYYLVEGEDTHLHVSKSTRFIPKVMFVCAVARPRFDTRDNQHFDGKLGIWPFVVREPAKRGSRNRPKGTLVTKPLLVNQNKTRKMLVEKILPAIVDKWPGNYRQHKILIQQDNATPHIKSTDPEWAEAVGATGLDVDLVQQPANSPDLNVLDLGLFSAIQSHQFKKHPTDLDELIAAVEKSFYEEIPPKTINNTFLTLQVCMEE